MMGTVALAVPATFDCGMRQLAYKFGKQLLPRQGEFSSLFDALNLKDPNCAGFLEGETGVSIHQPTIPEGAVFVDAHNGEDTNSGTEASPFRSIETALQKSPTGTIVLRDGTFFLEESLTLVPKNSGLLIMAYPGEEPVISGGKQVQVSWEPYNVTEPGTIWEVDESTTTVWGAKADDVHVHDLGKKTDAHACELACRSFSGCTSYTWHDANQGGFANVCWGRIDGEWTPRSQSGHTAGRPQVAGVNIYKSKLNGQVAEVPGLQLNGERATRARYPNLPGGIEVTPGYGGMVSGGHADWTPPDFDKFGPVTYYTDNVSSHTRGDTPSNWYQHYTIGVNGLCSVYDPPVGYWCSENTRGGGAFPFRTPSGVVPQSGALPNSPYKDVSEMIVNVWRPSRWSNWMFTVSDYDPETGNITFGAGGNQGARGNDKGGDFFVENVFEELDHPGEFFYDKKTDELFLYYNDTGAPPQDMEVVVPQLRVLVNVSGSQWNPVRNVTLQGITFKSSRYTYMDPHGVPSAGDWALDRTGAIFLEGTESVKISGSKFERLDGNGVMISGYNRYATVEDSDFAFIGGNAMASWGYTNETSNSGFPYYREQINFPDAGVDGTDGNHPRFNQLLRNSAREVGLYEKQSSFYIQAKTAQSTISGNVFFNGPRAGINFNDGFGGGDDMNNNLVFSSCRESGDHGPFNSWDRQPYLTTVNDGTPSMRMAWRELHHNFLIDNYSPQEGVDNDDGSAYYHTHHNFMVYGRQGLKSDFGGHDNHHFGNIYAYIGRAMSVTGALAGHEDQFYDNKVIMTGKDVGNPRCSDDVPALLHDNAYYTPDGDLTECGWNLTDAQSEGFDLGSSVDVTPSDEAILSWAVELLGVSRQLLV